MVLMCIFLITNDIEHFCVLYSICFFGEVSVKSLVSYFNLFNLLKSFISCDFNYFCPVCGLSFHIFNSVFCTAKVFNFVEGQFFLMDYAFDSVSRNLCPIQGNEDFLMYFLL